MTLKQNTPLHIMLPRDPSDVLLKLYLDILRLILSIKKSILLYLTIFHYPNLYGV